MVPNRYREQSMWAERERQEKALKAQGISRTPALRSAIPRYALRSRSIVLCNFRLPLRFRSPNFRPAPLRFSLRSRFTYSTLLSCRICLPKEAYIFILIIVICK
jgi:hypothetical protein